jgi:hypothetical protein
MNREGLFQTPVAAGTKREPVWYPSGMSTPLLTERFAKDIKGTIECFDRIVLFGTYGSVAYPAEMESLLHQRGVKLHVKFHEFYQ